MNRLYAEMTPEVCWFRHNWGFHDVEEWTGAMPHDFAWAPHVVPALRRNGGGTTGNDTSTQSETPTPPELGMWQRVADGGEDYIRSRMMHHIEFQTLRRLPRCRDFILFTVKRAQDPVSAVERYPGAAVGLAAAIRRKNKSSLLRNGLGLEENGVKNAPVSPIPPREKRR